MLFRYSNSSECSNTPLDRKGLGGNVIFIDTENTFRAERIFQIAEHRGISEPDEVLRKTYVCKIYNTSHLEVIIQDLGKSIEEHRAEFTGRGTLADRQQRLNIMLHKLNRLAEVHNIAVVVTNQVQSQPDVSLQAGMVYVLRVGTLWVMLLHIEFS
jgi:DNA repair protein RadA